jgi:hypothetical protein
VATTTGWIFPTANSDLSSGWSLPDRAHADNASGTTGAPTASNNWNTYDFSGIPSDAIIIGIEVEAEAFSFPNPSSARLDIQLTMDVGSATVAVGDTKSQTYSVYAWVKKQFGGAADLWGRSWTLAEIQDSNFGVECTTVQVSGSSYIRMDYVAIRVTYNRAKTTTVGVSVGVTTTKSISRITTAGVSVAVVTLKSISRITTAGISLAVSTLKSIHRTMTVGVGFMPAVATDWHNPSDHGQIDDEWLYQTNAYTSDNLRAEADGGAAEQDEQDYHGFGFNLPSTDVITGAEVSVEGKVLVASSVRATTTIVKAGAKVGLPGLLSFTGVADAYVSDGGDGEMWNTTLAPADVNASTFGVHFDATTVSGSGDLYIDHVRMRLWVRPSWVSSIHRTISSGVSVLATTTHTWSLTRISTVAVSLAVTMPRSIHRTVTAGIKAGVSTFKHLFAEFPDVEHPSGDDEKEVPTESSFTPKAEDGITDCDEKEIDA